MKICSFILLLAATLCNCHGCSDSVTIQALTDSGYVSGTTEDGTWVYRGIPYATAPTGELRWKPPTAVAHWDGVRAATEFAPACPQSSATPITTGENCLYLNIWLPAGSQSSRNAVMFFIHGGGFIEGAGSLDLYNGHELAKKDVVVVTMNYRLGSFGFLAHPKLDAESADGVSGNYGLLDQMAALRWVQNNITAFGGDPSRVTVFGESAGATSILILLSSPSSAGLYQQAIVESGPIWKNGVVVDINRSKAAAEQVGEEFAASLGCSGDDVLAQMRAKTADELVEATSLPASIFWLLHTLKFVPTVDGSVLPENPADRFANGQQNSISLMIGNNANEGNSLIGGLNMAVSDYEQYLTDRFGANANTVLQEYPAATDAGVTQAMSDLMTGLDFVEAAKFATKYMSAVNGNVYLYRFSYPVDPTLLAYHGSELPYVFGTIGATSSAADREMSDQMMSMWVNFAKTGDPNGAIDVVWPKYTTAEDSYLDINVQSEVKTGYGTSLTGQLDELGIR